MSALSSPGTHPLHTATATCTPDTGLHWQAVSRGAGRDANVAGIKQWVRPGCHALAGRVVDAVMPPLLPLRQLQPSVTGQGLSYLGERSYAPTRTPLTGQGLTPYWGERSYAPTCPPLTSTASWVEARMRTDDGF